MKRFLCCPDLLKLDNLLLDHGCDCETSARCNFCNVGFANYSYKHTNDKQYNMCIPCLLRESMKLMKQKAESEEEVTKSETIQQIYDRYLAKKLSEDS